MKRWLEGGDRSVFGSWKGLKLEPCRKAIYEGFRSSSRYCAALNTVANASEQDYEREHWSSTSNGRASSCKDSIPAKMSTDSFASDSEDAPGLRFLLYTLHRLTTYTITGGGVCDLWLRIPMWCSRQFSGISSDGDEPVYFFRRVHRHPTLRNRVSSPLRVCRGIIDLSIIVDKNVAVIEVVLLEGVHCFVACAITLSFAKYAVQHRRFCCACRGCHPGCVVQQKGG
ncbi:hypothetical protein BDM02DRAFT_2525756 [Thelephora ganbajun]|uniref:Uncharacterized protein n=1 Tax=Thelephora ganbajun TaxID=370292 RepID=A0ACB6ZDN2_THEGA|nr:hypothetical protein BDM02DRAFT_2525756 [Thelephora ganbajun]